MQKTSKSHSFLMISFFLIFFIFSSLHAETSLAPEQLKEEESTSKNQISDWEARLELARVLSYLKQYDESIDEYKKLLEEKPDAVQARIEMAKVLFYQDKPEESLAEFAKVPSQQLSDADWVVMADIFRKSKNYQKAEEIYFEYLKNNPQDDKVRLKLAELLSWQKRFEESISQYRQILSNRPDDIQVRRRYAQVLTWMGQDEEAVIEWKKTLK